MVSIHATLAGGDCFVSLLRCVPTLVSIHATLAGGDCWIVLGFCRKEVVSIHATLAGGDSSMPARARIPLMFLSTPPSRVATSKDTGLDIPIFRFLSTPPSRVATASLASSRITIRSFYPRHPRGWRRTANIVRIKSFQVSIHATLAGGDALFLCFAVCQRLFLSTPPSRVATEVRCEGCHGQCVSIHATLAGGD